MRYENILVTGGSGLLGRFVVDELLGKAAVSVLDIAVPAESARDRVTFHPLDIMDADRIGAAMAGQDAVIHLAGIDDGNPFSDHDYFHTNVGGAWNVLHAAEAAGVRQVVVASSSASYGLGADRAPDSLPVTEDHPQRPSGTYGHTKEVIERTARHYARRGALRVVCLRPTLIVRPEREAAILAQLALPDPHAEPPPDAPGRNGEPPYGALSVLRTYVRSRDAARCFRLALDYDARPFDIFNVAAPDGIGHPSTLDHLAAVYGTLPPIGSPERFERDPHASVFDASRARELLGWQAAGDWRDVERDHA